MAPPRKARFELITQSEACSFALREFKLPAFTSPWHFHEEIELTWIRGGGGQRFVGDNIEPFGPGDLVLVGANLPHYWRSAPAAGEQPDAAHSVVLQFRLDALGGEFFHRPELREVRRLLVRAQRGLAFGGRTAVAAGKQLGEMQAQTGVARVIGLLELLQRLAGATSPRQLSSAGFVPHLDQFASERINAAYQYIFAHFVDRLNYEEVARAAGMSLSAFSHYFRRVTGRTVSSFVNEVRIGRARRLLMETEHSVAEVAFACGFETLSSFNRVFKHLSGTSPGEYRRRHRASDPAPAG